MPFGMVNGVDRGMGVLDGVEIIEGKGAVLGVYCNQWGLCGIVILCRERWRRGSSKTISEFLVYFQKLVGMICSYYKFNEKQFRTSC